MNDLPQCIRYEVIKIGFKKEYGGHKSNVIDLSREENIDLAFKSPPWQNNSLQIDVITKLAKFIHLYQ